MDFPEYLAHISGYAERAAESEEFMESEMGYFNELDLNGDGGLNQTEVKEWIRPEGSNPIDAEVQHMMRKMDLDEGISSQKLFSIRKVIIGSYDRV